jgi:polysaccharide export outer membrane protein
MVDIHVFEEPDLDGAYRLNEHGEISMPLAGTIHLESLTLQQAQAAVSAKLEAEEILKAPHVVVNIDEYSAQNIVVMGEVAAPGRYTVLTPRKLMDVLAMAGGQTALAGNEIVIHRLPQPPQVTEVIHYNRDVTGSTALTVAINPGDAIEVKRAGIVYVLGAVNRPGGFVMQEAGELNIAQSLALAFGTAPQASIGGIRVIRKLPDGSLAQIPAKYNKFRNGEARPLALQAEDVVFVPSNKLKSAFIETKTVLSSAASATIYTVR